MSARPASPLTAKQRYEARKAAKAERVLSYHEREAEKEEHFTLLLERFVDAVERIADALEPVLVTTEDQPS